MSIPDIDRFAHPEALFLLVLPLLYIIWYKNWYVPRRLIIPLSYDPVKLNAPKYNLAKLRFIPRITQYLGLLCIIIALARPQSAEESILKVSKGIDIVLAIDISGSMEANDFLPNRLEVAKETALEFIEARKEDRIGLILFAQEALTYSPLTLDHDFLKRSLKSIRFNQISKEGTAMGSAIALAINRMRDSESVGKILILLTDGANNRGQMAPITAARLARRFGIKIYAIGIGSRNPAKSGIEDEAAVLLDEQSLEEVSKISGGNFFMAEESQELETIFKEISSLEKVEYQEKVFRKIEDHYPFFLKLAVVCLIFSFLSMLSFMYNPLEH